MYNPDIHRRRSIRLRDYDYSLAGAYFVTICTKDRECLFGEISEGKMRINFLGGMIQKWWMELMHRFKNIGLDELVIMPNHMHGIIFIADDCRGEVSSPLLKNITQGQGNPAPTENNAKQCGGETPPLRKNIRKYTLGQIVAYFKYQTTKDIKKSRGTSVISLWQRNYYERIIRNEKELSKIREYIQNNPLKWSLDCENSERIGVDSLEDEIFR
jgi:putative transposase